MKNQRIESRRQKTLGKTRISRIRAEGGAAPEEAAEHPSSNIQRKTRPGRITAGLKTQDSGHETVHVKRPPLERMHKIYGWLRDGEYPNCGRITAEFEVDRKTALRDIGFMQDRMGLPIGYDDKRHGYFFNGPVAGFPGVAVTEKELFGLCVVHKAIEHYQGTALQQPLELLFQKVTGQLDDQERFTLQNLDEVLSFRPFAPDDADLRLFELVSRAVSERRGLNFQYANRARRARRRAGCIRII
jgi:predicted DNA-binding transcriptional regulator YafY